MKLPALGRLLTLGRAASRPGVDGAVVCPAAGVCPAAAADAAGAADAADAASTDPSIDPPNRCPTAAGPAGLDSGVAAGGGARLAGPESDRAAAGATASCQSNLQSVTGIDAGTGVVLRGDGCERGDDCEPRRNPFGPEREEKSGEKALPCGSMPTPRADLGTALALATLRTCAIAKSSRPDRGGGVSARVSRSLSAFDPFVHAVFRMCEITYSSPPTCGRAVDGGARALFTAIGTSRADLTTTSSVYLTYAMKYELRSMLGLSIFAGELAFDWRVTDCVLAYEYSSRGALLGGTVLRCSTMGRLIAVPTSWLCPSASKLSGSKTRENDYDWGKNARCLGFFI